MNDGWAMNNDQTISIDYTYPNSSADKYKNTYNDSPRKRGIKNADIS